MRLRTKRNGGQAQGQTTRMTARNFSMTLTGYRLATLGAQLISEAAVAAAEAAAAFALASTLIKHISLIKRTAGAMSGRANCR